MRTYYVLLDVFVYLADMLDGCDPGFFLNGTNCMCELYMLVVLSDHFRITI